MTSLLTLLRRNPSVASRGFLNRPFLMVDWMSTGVAISQVSFSGKVPSVLKSQFILWPETQEPMKRPLQAGEWLKDVCTRAGYDSHAVVISVPRRDLSVRVLELPAVTDDEISSLVQLQVESKFQSPSQPIIWDLLIHPKNTEGSQRDVVLVSMPASVVDSIKLAATAAGWSNVILTSGDVAIGLGNGTALTGWQINVQASSVKLEVTLCHNGLPMCSSAMTIRDSSHKEMAATVHSVISRMLAANPNATNAPATLRVLLCGTNATSIADGLRNLGYQTQVWNEDDRAPRALAVAGSLLNNEGLIDFLQPRSIDPKTMVKRRRRAIIAATAVSVCLVAGTTLYCMKNSLDEQLALLESERQQLQSYLDRGQATVDKWAFLDRWQKSTVNTAAEIRDLAKLLPEQGQLIVTRLQVENLVDADDSVLRIDGLAEDSTDVVRLNESIVQHADRYEIRPQGIEPSPEGSELASQFRIELMLRNKANDQQEPVQ